MAYYATDECDSAVKAYLRWAKRNGMMVDQPCRHDTEQFGDVVHVKNVNGALARYRVLEDGRLRRVWPK